MRELTVENTDFSYIEIESLPQYWGYKIRGFMRRSPACPWDGGALVKHENPVAHVSCLKCGRNYA